MEKVVIIGPASQGLGYKIAQLLNVPAYATETKKFPDGECYVRIQIEEESQLKDKDVIIVQTTGANFVGDQNQRIIELIMMISAVKRLNPANIRVVVPYLAYSRQDKIFRLGESIFGEEICRIIETAGATEFYTIDHHAPKSLSTFKIPYYNLNPMKVIAQELKNIGIRDPVVISPDKGAYERSHSFAQFFGENIPVEQFVKKRDVLTGAISMEGHMNCKNRDVVIADDIIATGGTMASAIEIAKKNGAHSIYAIGTHSLLINNAVYSLLKAGTDKIISTDTIDTPVYQVSIAQVIVEAINQHV